MQSPANNMNSHAVMRVLAMLLMRQQSPHSVIVYAVMQVSAMLLKEYREQFAGAPLSATYHFLRSLLMGALPNNPLVTHETDTRHLCDPVFLSKALEYR